MALSLASPAFTKSSLFGEGVKFGAKIPAAWHRPASVVLILASSAEPKWKQKLAAVDDLVEKSRQASAQAQQEYFRKQAEQRTVKIGDVEKLESLEFYPFLTEEGSISDVSSPDAKASVYAIFDDTKTLNYIGISRQVYQSMRLHFARVPTKCFYVKIQNLSRPSRALLEGIRDQWIVENGSTPPGNDNGYMQNIWENPLDCKPLMTDEEKLLFEEAAPGPPKAKVLKNAARRIQAGLEQTFQERKCVDQLRFDPKLKDRGLLDLKGLERKPDTSVPTSTPTSKADEVASSV